MYISLTFSYMEHRSHYIESNNSEILVCITVIRLHDLQEISAVDPYKNIQVYL